MLAQRMVAGVLTIYLSEMFSAKSEDDSTNPKQKGLREAFRVGKSSFNSVFFEDISINSLP